VRRAAQGREVVPDPAALLHGQRCLAQVGEDPAHIVGDRPHDEAVEQSPAARCPHRDDTTRRQKFENRSWQRKIGRVHMARRLGAASAVATRRQVSSIVLSRGSPEGPLSRYFMSQICCDIEATTAMAKGP
jgi:hypothetical protein